MNARLLAAALLASTAIPSALQAQVDPSKLCGTFLVQRPVDCRWVDTGQPADVRECTDPKPRESKTVTYTQGCSYAWTVSNFLDPGPSCTPDKTETRSVTCVRNNDGVTVDDAFCTDPRPDATRTVEDYSACTYSWLAGDFVDPGATCSPAKTETRSISCVRSLDKAVVSDALCDASSKPSATETVADYSTCAYAWSAGDFADPGASCTASETQTRSVVCKRLIDGATVADSFCPADSRPDTIQKVADYSGCTYSASDWTDWSSSSSCSANATETKTAKCLRSDGTAVDSSECTSRGIAVSQTQTVANYVACSNSWVSGAFVDPGASCTAKEVQSRDVWCQRDLDGAKQPDASCDPSTKPATTQTVPDYSGCSFSWEPGAWGDWSSTCSATASHSRDVTCVRSDGTVMDAADPTQAACVASAGAKPPTSETKAVYDGCGYSWSAVTWGAVTPSCGATTQSGTVSCVRSDGTVVADSNCSASTKPATSKGATDYSTCTFSAVNPTTSWDSTCSSKATQTTTYQCKRSDGTIMPDTSACTAAGVATTTTSTSANYSSCSYSWATGAYVDPGASCTSAETQTRSVWCKRDLDGTTVADSYCSAASKPGTTQSVADYSGCTYSAVNGVGSWNSTCSANATYTTTYQCKRSDGTVMPNTSACTAAGVATTTTSTGPNYSTCSYAWSSGPYVDPGASCTSAEIQTRSVVCQRTLDNATVADSYCTGTKPGTTQSVPDYSGCNYSAVNGVGSWNSTCSSNATYTTTYQCKRSDGTIMPDTSACTAAGVATTTTSTGANYSGCTYTPSVTASSTCSGGYQTASVTCRRSDGTYVASTYCGYSSSSTTQACTSYAWSQGAWSAQQNVCTTGTQTRSVVCQAQTGGSVTTTADNYCAATVAKPATTQSYSNTGACTYSWTMSGWSDWNSHCSTSAVSTRTGQCYRSDGAPVDGSLCTNSGVGEPATSQSASVTDGCSYTPVVESGWTACTNSSQSRTVMCTRSDGATVAGDYCGYPGSTQSQSCNSCPNPHYISNGTAYNSANFTSSVPNYQWYNAQLPGFKATFTGAAAGGSRQYYVKDNGQTWTNPVNSSTNPNVAGFQQYTVGASTMWLPTCSAPDLLFYGNFSSGQAGAGAVAWGLQCLCQ